MENKLNPKHPHIPRDQRKTILFLSDDMRMHSGVGRMSKEIVLTTAHRFNWVQLGAAVKHPEEGKIFDMSEAVNQETGINDSLVRVYPSSGYGNPDMIRFLINRENVDAILHFTDPRFWLWLYQIESELRQEVPLFFYHIWDDTPYPKYNRDFYRSCDWIGCISKQTYNIVKQVWQNGDHPDEVEDWQIKYVPHGIPDFIFRPVVDPAGQHEMNNMRMKLFGSDEVDFVLFWNNRNIRRKMVGDIILAYDHFLKTLPKEKADRCRLVMHTQPVDENGTDIPAVIRDCTPDAKVVFSTDRLTEPQLNLLYNIADVTINLASNEGFGISTLESMMAGTPIIVNVTGGLQDQCGFMDEEGNYLDPDDHFGAEFGTNAWGDYTKHGEWVIPVFPSNRALIGSPQTPYIFDDRADYRDAGKVIREFYDMTPEERKRRGLLGREFAKGASGFTAANMGNCFIEGMEEAFEKREIPPRYRLLKVI